VAWNRRFRRTASDSQQNAQQYLLADTGMSCCINESQWQEITLVFMKDSTFACQPKPEVKFRRRPTDLTQRPQFSIRVSIHYWAYLVPFRLYPP